MVIAKEVTIRSETDITSSIITMLGVIAVTWLIVDMVKSMVPTGVLPTSFAQYIQAQAYVGVSDPREVEATDELTYIDLVNEHPYIPWVSVNFVNDGPDSVWIAINYPAATYELKAGETASVYRIGAQERISAIFFICSAGEGTSIRVVGEY